LLDVLEIIDDNVSLKKTHVLYKANLCPGNYCSIIDELVEKGLVQFVNLKMPPYRGLHKSYRVTGRGLELALCWRKVKEYLR